MCMIDGCDERYEVYNDRWVVSARKAHRCGECQRTILPGEEYRYTWGLYDGYWMGNKVCHHCTFATRWLWENCGGYMDEGVLEDILYHLEEEVHPGDPQYWPMARIRIGMRHQWERKKGGLMPLPNEIPNLNQEAA